MLDGIRVTSSLVITMAKEHVLNNSMGDWLGVIAHRLIKVAVYFPPRATGKYKKGDFRPWQKELDVERGAPE